MTENKIKERLVGILEGNGIQLFNNDFDSDLYFDSMQFISIIVEIETAFGIEIPDEELDTNKIHTYNDFYNLVLTLTSVDNSVS